jgi:hypothetical protein
LSLQGASNQPSFPAHFTLNKQLSLSEAEVLFIFEARNIPIFCEVGNAAFCKNCCSEIRETEAVEDF